MQRAHVSVIIVAFIFNSVELRFDGLVLRGKSNERFIFITFISPLRACAQSIL